MNSGRIGWELAVLASLCVLSIFLFPSVQGPYSVIHGPVTALRAMRAAANLRGTLLAAAISLLSLFRGASPRSLSSLDFFGLQLPSTDLSELTTILRC